MTNNGKKPKAKKVGGDYIWSDKTDWTVRSGELKRQPGRPDEARLFKAVAEKIPFGALREIAAHLKKTGIRRTGVYIAHDSMGVARYIGRGSIFHRLKARQNAQPLELVYFSFYVVADSTHEREIETLLIRAAGPQLHFNTKKKRVDIAPGNVRDYEAGTLYYQRQHKKGKKQSAGIA
jgi:hypothetical protein